MEREKYRTREGLTEFNFKQIAAITICDNDLVDVHLCSGTIFTVLHEDVNRFLSWYYFCKDTGVGGK
tara:strand:- start:1470 stop:1670 length:201 start_codon:yes stop_codon:yes gene_type:complete